MLPHGGAPANIPLAHPHGHQQASQQAHLQAPPELVSWLNTVLAPVADEYGRPELLLCLHGTVSAVIGNSTYRIPVEIWIPKAYPYSPPFAFVRPTQDMLIHPGNYVDTNGRCYHPYLSHWHESVQNSSILELVRLLGIAFGKEPPVYAKPPNYQPPPPSQQQHQQQPQPQLQQQQQPQPQLQPQSQSLPQAQPQPQPQPQPQLQPAQQQPQLQQNHPHATASPLARQSSVTRGNLHAPPPLPPHPETPTRLSHFSGQSSPLNPQHSGSSSINTPLSPTHTGNGPPIPPLPQQFSGTRQSPALSNTPLPTGTTTNQTIPITLPSHTTVPQGILPYSVTRDVNSSVGQRPAWAKQQLDIMDMTDTATPSVSGTAPSGSNIVGAATPPKLPPNPQKIRAANDVHAALTEIVEKELQPMVAHNDIRLLQTRETLLWMERAVNNELTDLDRITAASQENEAILTQKISQAKAVIEDAKSREEPKIDEVVCAETVVYNQLYDLVSESYAIDDTLYVLSKALDKGRISLESFLRHTRILSREQFMKRALVDKISTQLGLAANVY
ncbi:uncharacterized protein SAPINGB_P001362 [Magnusiomyces paraingens]|uniref:UEV domain-containing protein n=1 Tax=Magnusiomyces paraingens TaxID=2606893 RepID=A0A5E8B5V0_9ASCO|nr:uncharacterized protein SAPINGB_P001362 [Saprochaete ingens]VVT46738.1 unnamed protein product [Saprochaete ingens]